MISSAIQKALPDFDLILCGQFAIDGDTAQTGPCIASLLNIPQVTYVKDITEVKKGVIRIILAIITFGVIGIINFVKGIILGVQVLKMTDEEYAEKKGNLSSGFPA